MNNNLKTIFVVVLILVITSVVSLDIGIEDNAIITSTSSYKIENDDGGYTYVNTLGYSYYQDGNLWKKINTSITPQSIIISGNEYTLGVTEGFYNAYFREKSSKVYGRPVALVKDDYIITYSPGDYLKFDDGTQVSGKKLTTAEVSENGICYNGQYGAGIDLCYEYSIDTVKELLIIDSFSLLPIPENNSNLELKHITRIYNNNNNDDGLNITYGSSRIKVNDLDEINTNEEVYIMGNYNNTIFYLPEIYAWETKHNEIVNSSDYTEEEIIEMGFDPQFVENNTLYEIPVQSRIKLNRTIKNNRFGNLDIRIKTPYSWLENLTYPVYIDDTTTYNVDGSPNKAYWIAIYWDGNILSGEPIDARGLYPPRPLNYYDLSKDFISEYDSTMYDYIASDDGDKNEWLGDQSPGSDTYVNLLYNFSIAETVGNITSIEVLWNGYTSISATPAFYFGIWNYTSADWSVINITNDKSAADVDWGTTLTSGFSDYISDGTLHLTVAGDFKPQSGCIFVYSYDGELYYPELALTDMQSVDSGWIMSSYGTLNKLKPINNTLKLSLWEKVPENSYIDTLDLIEIKPIYNRIILPEQYTGELHTIKKSAAIYPTEFSNNGDDYTEQVSKTDDKYWVTNLSKIDLENVPMWDESFFTINTNKITNEKPKIVIRAKETGLFGRIIQELETAMIGPNVKKLPMDDQGIEDFLKYGEDAALSLYYKNDTEDWEYIGRWFFGNVEFYHTYAMELNISVEKEMKFKLVGMPYGFQIDEIYMDISKDKKIETNILKPTVVENNMYRPNYILTEQLQEEDYNFVLSTLGDAFTVNYNTECKDCSYVLKSVGTAELWTLPEGEINESLVYDWFVNRGERQVVNHIKDKPLKTSLNSETKVPHNTLYEDYVEVIVTYTGTPEINHTITGTKNWTTTADFNNETILTDVSVLNDQIKLSNGTDWDNLMLNYNITDLNWIDNANFKYNGTATGTPTLMSDAAQPVTNWSSFNSNGEYITIANPGDFSNTDNISIEFWLKFTHSATQYPYIFGISNLASGDRISPYIWTDNKLVMSAIKYTGGVVVEQTNSDAMTPGLWYHYVLSYTSGGQFMCRNGDLHKSNTAYTQRPALWATIDEATICKWKTDYGGDCATADTSIGNVRIYNRSITTAAECAELYNSNESIYYPNYYPNTLATSGTYKDLQNWTSSLGAFTSISVELVTTPTSTAQFTSSADNSTWEDWTTMSVNGTNLISLTGANLYYKFELNDSSKTESPIILNYTISELSADSCTYGGSGDWIIDCSDSCEISSAYDLSGNNLFISGTGFALFTAATPYNYVNFKIEGTDSSNRCLVRIVG